MVGFKPTYGLVPIDGCFPLAPSFDHVGPMARDVAGCERMMEALVPGFSPVEVSLGDLRVGVAWTERADPLVRARVEAVAAASSPSACRGRTASTRRSRARSSRSTPSCTRLTLRSTTRAWRRRWTRAEGVTDAQVGGRGGAERERYRERIAALEVDLLVTPTVPMVAPPVGIGDLALRERMIELTFPWNVVGAPAWRCRAGRPRTGCRRRCSSWAAPGEDALVLAAGRALAGMLPPRCFAPS